MVLTPQGNSLSDSHWEKNRDVSLPEPVFPLPLSPLDFFLFISCSLCSMAGIARCQICSSISSESRTMLPQHYARCHPAAFTHTFDVIFFPKHGKSTISTAASSLPPTFLPNKSQLSHLQMFFSDSSTAHSLSIYCVQKEKMKQLAFIQLFLTRRAVGFIISHALVSRPNLWCLIIPALHALCLQLQQPELSRVYFHRFKGENYAYK